jgi:CRP-like cAMP-binding protein
MTSPREVNRSEANSQVDDALAILRRLPVFKNISLDLVRLYAYLSHKEQYKRGDRILCQGKQSDGMRLLIHGDVSITHTVKGREILLQKLSAHRMNYFGELALISNFQWFFSAYAWNDVFILSISRESFAKVIERYPETYAETVAEIVKLRVHRFKHQTDYLVGHLEEEALCRLAMTDFPENDPEYVKP